MSKPPTDRRVGPKAPSRPLQKGEVLAPNGGILRPFQKGHTGNPQGIYGSGAYHEARRICAEASPEAARKQVELMGSDDHRVVFMATEAVLNRGAGKPRDHSSEQQATRINVSALNPEERLVMARLLLKAMCLETPTDGPEGAPS